MSIRVVGFDKWENKALKGFITVAITDDRTGIEFLFEGFSLFEKGNVWVELPGLRDENGQFQKNAKTMYCSNPIMEKQFKNIILKELDIFLSQDDEKVEVTNSPASDHLKFD